MEKQTNSSIVSEEYYWKNRMNIALKVALGLGLVATTTGCSQLNSHLSGWDEVTYSTERGIKARGDHNSSLIINGKSSPDAPTTSAIELRKIQETERTKRKLGHIPAPTFQKPEFNGGS